MEKRYLKNVQLNDRSNVNPNYLDINILNSYSLGVRSGKFFMLAMKYLAFKPAFTTLFGSIIGFNNVGIAANNKIFKRNNSSLDIRQILFEKNIYHFYQREIRAN